MPYCCLACSSTTCKLVVVFVSSSSYSAVSTGTGIITHNFYQLEKLVHCVFTRYFNRLTVQVADRITTCQSAIPVVNYSAYKAVQRHQEVAMNFCSIKRIAHSRRHHFYLYTQCVEECWTNNISPCRAIRHLSIAITVLERRKHKQHKPVACRASWLRPSSEGAHIRHKPVCGIWLTSFNQTEGTFPGARDLQIRDYLM